MCLRVEKIPKLGDFEGLDICPSINQGRRRTSRHSSENRPDPVVLISRGTSPAAAGRVAAAVPPPLHLLLRCIPIGGKIRVYSFLMKTYNFYFFNKNTCIGKLGFVLNVLFE